MKKRNNFTITITNS